MAATKISALGAATALAGTEVLPVVQGGATVGATVDQVLARGNLVKDGANTLAQRNGTTAQIKYVYNTYTDGSNYERATMSWAANILKIGMEAAGTGSNRAVEWHAVQHNFFVSGVHKIALNPNIFAPVSAGLMNLGAGGFSWGKLHLDYTNTATVGAVTINKAAGRVNIASGATSVVVTNSLVTAATIVYAVAAQADANNPGLRSVVPAAGSFTINISTAPAANQAWSFTLINTD
jgi:hypothetical protein